MPAALVPAILGALAFLALVVIALGSLLAPALAQDGTTVDLSPLILGLMPYVSEVVIALVGLVVVPLFLRALRWIGLEIDRERRDALNAALERAVAFGLSQAEEHALRMAGRHVDVKHHAAAAALRYAMDATPGAIRHFGLTPDRLREMIEARFALSPFEKQLVDETREERRA